LRKLLIININFPKSGQLPADDLSPFFGLFFMALDGIFGLFGHRRMSVGRQPCAGATTARNGCMKPSRCAHPPASVKAVTSTDAFLPTATAPRRKSHNGAGT
jgi:hypothetical protein